MSFFSAHLFIDALNNYLRLKKLTPLKLLTFFRTTRVSWYRNIQQFGIFFCVAARGTAHLPAPCPCYVHSLARQQTVLQDRNTEGEQRSSDPRDFTLDVFPVTTLPINPGLGPAPKYTGYTPQWLGYCWGWNQSVW